MTPAQRNRRPSPVGWDRTKPSICFVAHNAYGALCGEPGGHIGGIERQQALMAHWLAARGYAVSMITWAEGERNEVNIAGVRVLKMCAREEGIRYLRFVHPRWTSLCRALRRADAEVYYYNCGDLGLGQIAAWCRAHGRKCVYAVASDPDCDPRLPALGPLRERLLYRYGLRHVDYVIAQTARQREMLRAGFGINAAVLPMACPGLGGRQKALAKQPDGREVRVLWVGRFSPEKRLEWLLDLAQRRPDWVFDVVGAANRESAYSKALGRRAEALANVRAHGRVGHDRIAQFYLRATALCCTSRYEGFPNTFLEAWSVGLPVVSTVDPDGVIAKNGCGSTGTSVEQLAEQLRRLAKSPQYWQSASEAGRQYYQANHTLEASMTRFEGVFQKVTARRGRAAAPGRSREVFGSQLRYGVRL